MTAAPSADNIVRAWRARLGLTQAGASRALGLALSHYQRLEAGGYQRDGVWRDLRPTLTQRLAMAAVEAGLDPA